MNYTYEGLWKDNQKNGKGTFEWTNGAVYVGGYVDDKKHGQGTFYYADGRVYVGTFKGGKLHGKGEMYKDGKVTKGTWVGNVLDEETKVVEEADAPEKPEKS